MKEMKSNVGYPDVKFPDPRRVELSLVFDKEIIMDFAVSSEMALENLEQAALRIESHPADEQALGEVKRILHAIKGDSACARLPAISEMCHRSETVLEEIAAREQCPTDFLLAVKDWLQTVIERLVSNETSVSGQVFSPPEQWIEETPGSLAESRTSRGIRHIKILIAEDGFTSRNMLQAVLGKWGYTVVSTADGDEAWAAMQKTDAPQLAILDWMMPGLDGVTLCRKLREQNRRKPLYIILLTSRSERADIIRGLAAGADDYVSKPYDNQELLARINVGGRMLELQAALVQKEKLQGVLEMAGAVCHELNQPLQAISGWSELLVMGISDRDPNYKALNNINRAVDRIGKLTHKIMQITKYKTRNYLRGKIIDIAKASLRDN